MGVEVASFTIDNLDDSDVYITSVTFRDQQNQADNNLANLVLEHSGDILATTPAANGRYINFQLATPFLIEDGDEEDFEVYADVIDGAGDTISLEIERRLDVSGFDDRYGFGLDVDVSNYNPQTFTIEA